MNGSPTNLASQSAVIRARYMPDVRGVNRPVIIDPSETGCNIDKKPRELPYIECAHDGRRSPARTEIELVITSNVEDGRFKGHSSYPNGTLSTILPQLTNITKQNGRETKSKKSYRTTPSPKSEQNNDDLGVKIVRNHANLNSESSRCLTCKSNSTVSGESRCRSRSMNSLTSPRVNGSNGTERKMRNITAIQNSQRTAEIKPIPKLVTSKSAQNIEPEQKSKGIRMETENKIRTLITREVSTQTDNLEKRSSRESSTGMEDDEFQSRQQKATQTHDYTLLQGRSKDVTTELDDRSELYEVIDSALLETFDKYSRLRANQFIASSARKQAQIWRDAKEFVSTVLLPDGVALANRTKAARNASLSDVVAGLSLP
ncbi:hypothetical protein QR680_001865 [Steinernema hermaphroditum]|uniref:Uncharacterized protein n=1 Tax=Steinernema hermaphroditum TaxID=289476 RepID=A0AA39H294_9BILA|nr:hypothetical protein QR680_001865 [Steinernema hermaphroditum]